MNNQIPTGYLGDILAQPEALRNTIHGLSTSPDLLKLSELARNGHFRQVIMTGMGSSLHVYYPLYYRLIEQGWTTPVMIETSELIHSARAAIRPGTLILACSQSGRSAETLRLLEINRQSVEIIGVTNTPESPLAEQATACVLTHAGSETTVSCKTYLAALVAMEWLGDILLHGKPTNHFLDLVHVPGLVSDYLAQWAEHTAWLKDKLAETQNLFLAGRGASLASVGTGGLTTKESAHFHAEGMSSAAFRHGPLEMAGPGTCVVLFAGAPEVHHLHHGLKRDIEQAGGQVLWIGEENTSPALRLPPAPPQARPVLEMLPVQMMTLALAAIKGRVAGEFDRATKVTAKE